MGGAILTAIAIGAAIAFQVTVLSRAGGVAHPLAVSLALQVAGVIVGGAWVVVRRALPDVLTVAGQWWWLPIGALGWGVVAALGFAGARLGVAATLALSVSAQLAIGLGIDVRAGALAWSWRPITGVVLMIGGVLVLTSRP